MMRSYLLIISVFLFSNMAMAVEVYTAVDGDCRATQGLIIDITEDELVFLSLAGDSKSINRLDQQFLAVHNILQAPIQSIRMDAGLSARLRRVEIGESEVITGWPVRFIEDLVIFYDIKGGSQAVELEKISKIRPSDVQENELIRYNNSRPILDLGPIGSHCPDLEVKTTGLQPTRVMADKIQISEVFNSLEEGFENFSSYQERTYLYAKPYLYKDESKGGIIFWNDNYYTPSSTMPLYGQWSGGEAYGFQSLTQLGSVPVEYLPTPEPLLIIRSDVKSHIFNGTFVGNLAALSAGSQYYTSAMQLTESGTLELAQEAQSQVHASAALNYMALMGADWGPWSLSLGTSFPVHYVQVGSEFREILASDYSPVVKAAYTNKYARFFGIFSYTNLDRPRVGDEDLSRSTTESTLGFMESFAFSSWYLRSGVDYSFTSELSLSVTGLLNQGDYSEILIDNTANSMKYTQFMTTLSLRHDFGDYVSVSAYLNHFWNDYDYDFMGSNDTENSNYMSTGGAFEFIF